MANGIEMTAKAVADGRRDRVQRPRIPWRNVDVESLAGRLRHVLLAVAIFHTLLDVQVMGEDYRQHYNRYRPHFSPDHLTPDEFALQWASTNPRHTNSLAHTSGIDQVPLRREKRRWEMENEILRHAAAYLASSTLTE